MKLKEKITYTIICLIITCSIITYGGSESSAMTDTKLTSDQMKSNSVPDEYAADSTTASEETEIKDESKEEEASDESLSNEEVEVIADDPAGYPVIGGTWKVGGIYYKGHLIDINDNDAIESMYDTTMITFNEDGTFVYLKMYNDRGIWSEKKQGSEESFILKTESTFRYDLQNGSLVEKETETSNKKQYIVTFLDENTFILNEYDSITGKAKVNDDPYIFVKQSKASEYIANNKISIDNFRIYNSSADEKTSQRNNANNTNATSGEKNALAKALQYLDYSAFSYNGLIEQLEYEGFTSSEAQYGVDNCGADWNIQAVKKAKEYLNYSSFSRSELIEQLVFEGFTQSQAEYGVSHAYYSSIQN